MNLSLPVVTGDSDVSTDTCLVNADADNASLLQGPLLQSVCSDATPDSIVNSSSNIRFNRGFTISSCIDQRCAETDRRVLFAKVEFVTFDVNSTVFTNSVFNDEHFNLILSDDVVEVQAVEFNRTFF